MTMKQIKTAKEMLARIEEDFFRGVDLKGASLLCCKPNNWFIF
jgi:hypothetical protein